MNSTKMTNTILGKLDRAQFMRFLEVIAGK